MELKLQVFMYLLLHSLHFVGQFMPCVIG